jgi:hypothetical protein
MGDKQRVKLGDATRLHERHVADLAVGADGN